MGKNAERELMRICNRIEANGSGRFVCAYFSGSSASVDIEIPTTGATPPPAVEVTPPPTAEAVIFASNGPAYPGVGNGSTSGPTQGS